MSLIDRRQQFDIGASIALRKAMPPVSSRLDLALGPMATDQARYLRPALARHLGHVAP